MVYSINSKYIRTISNKKVFWNIHTENKELFLTFDDGPIPKVTEFILKELEKYNAKATFFCVGDNVRKNPDVFKKIIEQGHTIGNHTFHHINGWKYSLKSYLNNVKMCDAIISTKLFRPPYGRLTPLQRKNIQKDHYVLLWSVLPGDFDPKVTKQKCLRRIIKHSESGSIIVLHDSIKTEQKIKYVLPRLLDYFSKQGYAFSPITEEICAKTLENKRKFMIGASRAEDISYNMSSFL